MKKLFCILFIAYAYNVSGQNLVWQGTPTTLNTVGKVGIGEANTSNSDLLVTQVNNCTGVGGCAIGSPCTTFDPMFWVRQKWITNNSGGGTNTSYIESFAVTYTGVGVGLKNPLYPFHVQTGVAVANNITAYFGTAPASTSVGSRNMFFVNYLGATSTYNTIQKAGDQGIFWNDGQNITQNVDACNRTIFTNNGGFVIAPQQDPNAATTPAASGLRIDNTGKVGIGIMTPVQMLEVAGNIKCTKLIVTTQWWDKVFEKDYKLLTLPELEKYVLTYKHLPDLPTEQEVAKNGCDVGETTSLLLKKVEELTLYTIQLQKQVDELKKQLQEKK